MRKSRWETDELHSEHVKFGMHLGEFVSMGLTPKDQFSLFAFWRKLNTQEGMSCPTEQRGSKEGWEWDPEKPQVKGRGSTQRRVRGVGMKSKGESISK